MEFALQRVSSKQVNRRFQNQVTRGKDRAQEMVAVRAGFLVEVRLWFTET